MKKKLIITLLISVTLLLSGCCLKHNFSEATCSTPSTCTKCGDIQGSTLPHTWVDADCYTAKTCSVCGITEGQSLGHNLSEPTCTEDAKCLTCGAIGEKAKGHDWQDATTEKPKTCQSCGLTEGEPLPAETTIEENTESLEVETPKTNERTQEQIDADVQAVIDEIYRRRGIDPNTMQQGHIDAPPPEGGTPSTGDMGDYQFGSGGELPDHLKGAVIK